MSSFAQKTVRYRFGTFELDAEEGTLSRNGKRVKLQDLPHRLLCLLVERPGEIVSREELRQRLWPDNTFVEFDNSLAVAVRKVRDSLGDDADNPRFIETIPRRGYRFLVPVHTEGLQAAVPLSVDSARVDSPVPNGQRAPRRIRLISAVLALSVAFALVGAMWLSQRRSRIPEHAGVVVGDFTNSTGDPLFDGSLRRAVIIELAQSPYFSILTDQRLGEILQDLGRSPNDSLTSGLARQVCQRGQAVALVTGSIRATGSTYQLSMEAERCSNGSVLAQETLSVANRQGVLPNLGTMVSGFRRRLSESRESLQKFDVPVEQATTSSLEALKAYQLGLDLRAQSKNLEARPAFKTAIALDPNFAIAYAQLGSSYSNMGNTAEAKTYFQKAFELRSRATEPERLYIAGRYFDIVTRELEKGAETYKLWSEMYPNEWRPYNAVANDAYMLGRYETVVEASQQAVRLGPTQNFGYSNLISGLIGLNRLDEAKQICTQRIAQGHDESFIHLSLFAIAILQKNEQALSSELAWAEKHPDNADMTYARAQAAAARGKVKESTHLFEQVAKLDIAGGDRESGANAMSIMAEINSEMGRSSVAEKESEEALTLGKNEIVLGLGSLIAARAHNLHQAQELLGELDHDYPLSTFNIGVYSPMIRTTMAVSTGTSAAEVTNLMEPALPYEYGFEADMLPIYVRGMSYLDTHSPEDAVREFQKILDHHSVDAVTTLYPLSELGLARAYALLGRKEESRTAYQRFFELWKDADPDLPILLQARRESKTLS